MIEEHSQRKQEKQIETLEEALSGVMDSNVFIQLAESYRLQGRYPEAIEVCRKGLEKMPDALPGRLLLGRCYLEMGLNAEAKEELEKVAQGIEECYLVYKWLSQVYLQEKDLGKSLEVMKKALFFPSAAETGKHSVTPLEMDMLHRKPSPPFLAPKAESPKKTAEDIPTTEGKRPAQAGIQTYTLAEIYVKQGHLQRALSIYQEILDREPKNSAVREKYEALRKKLEKDQHISHKKKMVEHLGKWLIVLTSGNDSTVF